MPPFNHQTLSTTKTLSGAPATIILAMFLASGPVGRNDLVTATSYGKDKIQEGLSILATLGIAERFQRYQGWRLTSRARQLILPVDNSAKPVDNPVDNMLKTSQGKAGRSAQSTSPIITTINTDISNKGGNIKTKTDVPKSPQQTSPWEMDKHKPITNALRSAGVMKNDRTEKLLTFDHITPNYINAHHRDLIEKQTDPRYITGRLVLILESGKPAPNLRPNGHTVNCKCSVCKYK